MCSLWGGSDCTQMVREPGRARRAFRVRGWEAGGLGAYWALLCDLGRVAAPLWAAISFINCVYRDTAPAPAPLRAEGTGAQCHEARQPFVGSAAPVWAGSGCTGITGGRGGVELGCKLRGQAAASAWNGLLLFSASSARAYSPYKNPCEQETSMCQPGARPSRKPGMGVGTRASEVCEGWPPLGLAS